MLLRADFEFCFYVIKIAKERSNVPKFGNWEGEENVPYTAYFEKARKGRAAPGSRVTNPNDPEYNSDSRTKPEEVVDHPVRKSREGTRSREESELKQFGGGGGGDSGSSSNEKRQGKSSQNNSYDNKSPLHKNSYDGGAARSKPKPNLRPDESVRSHLFEAFVFHNYLSNYLKSIMDKISHVENLRVIKVT